MRARGNWLFMFLLGLWSASTLSGCKANDAKTPYLEKETPDVDGNFGPSVGVAEIMQNPTEYRGKRLLVQGFLVIEPENRNLWERGEAYGSNKGACSFVEVTDEIFNHREALSRREVVLSALVNVADDLRDSAESCKDIFLSDVTIVSFVTPLERLSVVPPTAESGWYDVNENALDMDRLRELAENFLNAMESSNDDNRTVEISRLVPFRHAARVSEALRREGSRIRWLLYDRAESFSTLMSLGKLKVVDVAQETRDSPSAGRRGALCFCARASCDTRTLSPQRVYFRGAADPYHCLPVLREKQDWVLDAGYLLGLPDEETMD